MADFIHVKTTTTVTDLRKRVIDQESYVEGSAFRDEIFECLG